ncbi:MAG: phosphoribosylformylglycinamidine synthase subunit PurS [Rhodothermales bacterium]|nr:phosphoribosylformylglycinamidine synthase subunit PurS [Rhodothermales bacterium]
MFKANVEVTLRPSILDPQGKAVEHALHDLGLSTVSKVRIGKHVELWVDADGEDAARSIVESACDKLLANPVMEDYTYSLESSVEPVSG